MVAYDPIRGTSIKQHPKISKDKDGNITAKGDPQVNSTVSTGVNRAKPTDPVSGTSTGELANEGKVKPGQVYSTSTGDTEDAPLTGDLNASKKKG